MSRDNLNLRQRKFVNCYVNNGGNASKAYQEAGYEGARQPVMDSMACRLLKNEKVKRAVNKALEIQNKAAQITYESKVVWLGDITEDGMQKVSPSDQSGSPSSTKSMIDSRASIAAISELNRMQGHHAATKANISIQTVSFSQVIGHVDDLDSHDEKLVDGEVLK